jgi:hypothetical protein
MPLGVRGSRPVDVRNLLYELCTQLGYCLPPDDKSRLIESPPSDIDQFTDAVLAAEGFDPAVEKRRRREVRAMVARHFALD